MILGMNQRGMERVLKILGDRCISLPVEPPNFTRLWYNVLIITTIDAENNHSMRLRPRKLVLALETGLNYRDGVVI